MLSLSVNVEGERASKLHSDSTEHVLPILLEFSSTLHSSATETIFHSEAFVCRPCVRSMETLQKLRADPRDKDFFFRISDMTISGMSFHKRDY